MPDLSVAFGTGSQYTWWQVALRLVVAAALGRVVALVYSRTRPVSIQVPSFPPTLVLLAVLISMVTQVIGDNVARAFSLVGALSIVRFRTVVRDTEDTAFVIFAVVVGMAVGSNHFGVALIGIVVVAGAAMWMSGPARVGLASPPYVLRVRAAIGQDLDALVDHALAGLDVERKLASLVTARQGLSMEASYHVQLPPGLSMSQIVKALNRTDGIQSVELTTLSEGDNQA